jgi:uncharacterized protein
VDVTNPVMAAIAAYLAYLLLITLLWRLGKVRYERLAESGASIVRGIVVPIGIGLVVLAVITTVLGWWDDVLTQDRRGPGWVLVVPVLIAVTALAGVARIDWRHERARLVPLLALGVLCVGGAEELLSRGLLVVGPQQAGWSLLGVWLFSTVLFSLLHAINGFFGLPWPGVGVQLVLTFLGGSAFFVSLMATGSLLVGVLLHALWDLGTLGMGATERQPAPWQLGLAGLTYLAGLAGAIAIVLA